MKESFCVTYRPTHTPRCVFICASWHFMDFSGDWQVDSYKTPSQYLLSSAFNIAVFLLLYFLLLYLYCIDNWVIAVFCLSIPSAHIHVPYLKHRNFALYLRDNKTQLICKQVRLRVFCYSVDVAQSKIDSRNK